VNSQDQSLFYDFEMIFYNYNHYFKLNKKYFPVEEQFALFCGNNSIKIFVFNILNSQKTE